MMLHQPPPTFPSAPAGLLGPWPRAAPEWHQTYAHLVGHGQRPPSQCIVTEDPGRQGRAAVRVLPVFSSERAAALGCLRAQQAQARAQVVQALPMRQVWSLMVPVDMPPSIAVIARSPRRPVGYQASLFDARGPWTHLEETGLIDLLARLHCDYHADLAVVPCWLQLLASIQRPSGRLARRRIRACQGLAPALSAT